MTDTPPEDAQPVEASPGAPPEEVPAEEVPEETEVVPNDDTRDEQAEVVEDEVLAGLDDEAQAELITNTENGPRSPEDEEATQALPQDPESTVDEDS